MQYGKSVHRVRLRSRATTLPLHGNRSRSILKHSTPTTTTRRTATQTELTTPATSNTSDDSNQSKYYAATTPKHAQDPTILCWDCLGCTTSTDLRARNTKAMDRVFSARTKREAMSCKLLLLVHRDPTKSGKQQLNT